MARTRLDQLLTDRGLARSRAEAQALIHAGAVELEGNRRLKPGQMVAGDAAVTVVEKPRWASRAGAKLEHALDAFGVEVEGRACLDAGASTGGFTDVLLSRGARIVYAVDVGRAQLIDRLKRDPRVVSMERTNLRELTELPEPIGLATLDLSFISLGLVLPGKTLLIVVGEIREPKPNFMVQEAVTRAMKERGANAVVVTTWDLLGVTEKDYLAVREALRESTIGDGQRELEYFFTVTGLMVKPERGREWVRQKDPELFAATWPEPKITDERLAALASRGHSPADRDPGKQGPDQQRPRWRALWRGLAASTELSGDEGADLAKPEEGGLLVALRSRHGHQSKIFQASR